ncbi:BSD-domain-containing protein [Saccharata proteae CBS 121410]|uniref:BSD-domain-containing protein n=1 Tax=Saccharata proteae CBS 121410 TaxID=1314787 RepID=A0A9P4I2N1_9PEZI|nr:BSD-domain-containing protein [Saccharata proteae CBS 121410]
MDVAYDHIQEESFPDDERRKEGDTTKDTTQQPAGTFNSEVQEAYKAISSSPWAARIGGLWGSVKKQGESYYEGARQEYSPAISQATTQATNTLSGLRSSLLDRTRNLSISQQDPQSAESSTAVKRTITDKEGNTIEVAAPTNASITDSPAADAERAESLPADIVKEAESMLSRLRLEGAKRLKEIQKAEDAADEALLKFGTNIRNFLRDAVTIAPPDENDPNSSGGATGTGSGPNKVLFESKDASGKRVIHTTRLDAQLHVIHSSLGSFEKDPESSPEWEAWTKSFDVSKKTEEISADLEKYEELRRAMEGLVPEKVKYEDFWRRYYFLRHVVESEDLRRREMLKASTTTVNEEISWDDDSDDDSSATPNPADAAKPSLANSKETLKPDTTTSSSTSSQQPTSQPQSATPSSAAPPALAIAPSTTQGHLKPEPSPQGRRSHDERSVTDSDASYDVVSGATSRGAGSPVQAARKAEEEAGKGKEEESDDDWE